MRWLTNCVDPDIFGEVTLLVGACGLAVNVLATPLIQAVMHEYPAARSQHEVEHLYRVFSRTLGRTLLKSFVVIFVASVAVRCVFTFSWPPLALTLLLLVGDSWRAAVLGMFNAEQRHKIYVYWVIADAWLRPLMAVLFIHFFGAAAETILLAYLCVSFAALLMGNRVMRWPFLRKHCDGTDQEEKRLEERLRTYASPLLPLGIIGWITGLADRYIIGGTIGLGAAGIYAAAAGLASRPVLMLGTALELAIRPRYQEIVGDKNPQQEKRILLIWIALVTGAGTLYVAALAEWREEIAALLLGKSFRSGSLLMPWVASGYVLLVTSYIFERVCYAHSRTRRVLSIQTVTAVVAIICLSAGAYRYGLQGAAVAVPVFYAAQLAASIYYAVITHRESHVIAQTAHSYG